MKTANLKLYRHYKGKPYKYLGKARHSETLDELVLYETRYENELGRVWVRPKDMFFSEVEIDGAKLPRFAPVEVDFCELEQVNAKDKENLLTLLEQIFGGYPAEKLEVTLKYHPRHLLLTATDNGRFIGFKLGYAQNNERFYSWLGAVDPEYRGIGLGKELIQRQHDWCRRQGFQVIETRTKNKWREMLLLNIQCGFQIVGTTSHNSGEPKILLEKHLTDS